MSKLERIKKCDISRQLFAILASTYETYGLDILFNSPQVDVDFRVKLTEWKIRNRTSYAELAAEFRYIGILQIQRMDYRCGN